MSMGIVGTFVQSQGGSSLTAHRLLSNKLEHYRGIFSEQPHIKREIEYFNTAMGKVKTSEDLVKDQRALRFLLTSFGLEEHTKSRAFIQKMIDGGLADEKSMANKMVDPRFRELVRHIDPDNDGFRTNLKNPVWIAQTAAKYITGMFEKEIGDANSDLRVAFYFERKAPSLTSWYQVLGDRGLNEFMRKALGLPAETAKIDVDKQVEMLKKKMDIADLKDPVKVQKLIQKYLARADAESGAGVMNSPVLQILNAPPPLTGMGPIVGFDAALLMKLNGVR